MAVTDLAFIDSAGYHVADYPSFLTYVQTSYQGIYGADVYLGPDSQDGQYLAIVAQDLFDACSLGASVYNSFSPVSAQGVGLSRNVKINGLERGTATNSTVDLAIGGTNGTQLNNAIAVDTLQQQWAIPNGTVIPGSGTVTVTASAVDEGAIQALPNTITGIFTPTQGWQTVNNPAAATPGTAAETDPELRVRQISSVALPSLTVLEGTLGAVENVPGVTQAVIYENDTGATDGNGLPAHSFSVVASGGVDSAVAQAIQIKKTPGTETYGSTSVTVFDSQGMPLAIHFYRPTPATISVQVTIVTNSNYLSSYAALIQTAMAAAVTFPNITIGGLIVITKLYVSAYLPGTVAGQSFTIVGIELAKNSGGLGTSNIQLLFNEIPICDASTNVTVVT